MDPLLKLRRNKVDNGVQITGQVTGEPDLIAMTGGERYDLEMRPKLFVYRFGNQSAPHVSHPLTPTQRQPLNY
jgi:hypothetical protein